MEVFKQIHNAVGTKHADAVLYAAGIGLIASDILPTPADAIYFHIEKRLRDQWKNGKLTPKQYWVRSAEAYYLMNPIWWTLVLGVMVATKGGIEQKIKIGGALIGAGAVAGVLYRNYRIDTMEKNKELR